MIRYIWCFLFFWLLKTSSAQEQESNQIAELITADYNMNGLANSRGVSNAYMSFTDENSIFFMPSPINALNYLKNKPNLPDVITWSPVLARVSKSNEWGFTTGPISWQRVGSNKQYGEYISVWRRDRKGDWKIAYRAQYEHKKPIKSHKKDYRNPENNQYVKTRSNARLKQREDIIFSTDKLFSTVLKADNPTAFNEFLIDGSRLYVPGYEPIIGLSNIKPFLSKQKIVVETEPENVDRSYSGELAYSNGSATLGVGNKVTKCHYIRIWELQKDKLWKVIVEMYFEK